jgi:hypothetical protein
VIFLDQFGADVDVQTLFLRKLNDICSESLPVIIWKYLLKQYSSIKFTVHTRYIFKSIL